MHASRNLRLCTKDCLCLYVCPTGAADTENGQIDFSKCTACEACVKACPSHAISLVPDKDEFPPQQPKTAEVTKALKRLAASKVKQEQAALCIMEETDDPVMGQFAEAAAKSNLRMAEDIYREAGYMLPQSGNTHEFLQMLLKMETAEDFPREAVEELLKLLPNNDAKQAEEEIQEAAETKRWRCSICGYIHKGPLPEDFKCPRCKQPASVFVKMEANE